MFQLPPSFFCLYVLTPAECIGCWWGCSEGQTGQGRGCGKEGWEGIRLHGQEATVLEGSGVGWGGGEAYQINSGSERMCPPLSTCGNITHRRGWTGNITLTSHLILFQNCISHKRKEWKWKVKDKRKITFGASPPWFGTFVINTKKEESLFLPGTDKATEKMAAYWWTKPKQKASGIWGIHDSGKNYSLLIFNLKE